MTGKDRKKNPIKTDTNFIFTPISIKFLQLGYRLGRQLSQVIQNTLGNWVLLCWKDSKQKDRLLRQSIESYWVVMKIGFGHQFSFSIFFVFKITQYFQYVENV